MKILVIIANYGFKNMNYLKSLLHTYRSMPFAIHLVVLSNVPKTFEPDVEVIVGLPSKNPWSLPFGYKKVMAERVNDYDLFIYSEDDTLVTEQNIRAFSKVSRVLPKELIAGFIRYEVDNTKERHYPTLHAHFHWDPCSVRVYGEYTVASFSNEHAACFMLTRDQLLRVIHSKGFFHKPREGRYDMLCTASTDPYTQCGLKKVICISHIDDFSLHHLPNIYWSKVGSSRKMLDIQLERLMSIEKGKYPSTSLFQAKTKLVDSSWDKIYYDEPRTDVLDLLPRKLGTVLSIGCGWGATEEALALRGARVTAIPMDTVVAACTEARGIETTSPNFEEALKELRGREYDCLLFTNVLEYLPKPLEILDSYMGLLKSGGILCATVHNVDHIAVIKAKIVGKPMHRDMMHIGNYDRSGLQRFAINQILRKDRNNSLSNTAMRTALEKRFLLFSKATFGVFDRWLSSHHYYIGCKAK